MKSSAHTNNTVKNPLSDLIFLEKECNAFGFSWPNQEMILQQAISECHEIQEAILMEHTSDHIQEEIGDLLHAAISLCLFSGYDLLETLEKVSTKFSNRFDLLKKAAKLKGLDSLHGQNFDTKLELWHEIKRP